MAPRQTTIKQTEAIIRQINTLVDSLDFKSLTALHTLYVGQYAYWVELVNTVPHQTKEGLEFHNAEATAKHFAADMARALYHYKRHRERIKNEHLSRDT